MKKIEKLFVVAAGNGTRLGNTGIPKALTLINGEPNLVNIVKTIGHHYENIVVSVQDKHVSQFEDVIRDYDLQNVTLKVIESGMGSGDAVLRTLIEGDDINDEFASTSFQVCHMCWGDVHFKNDKIVQCMLDVDSEIDEVVLKNHNDVNTNRPKNAVMIIPTIFEQTPYLRLVESHHDIIYPRTSFRKIEQADFSRSQDGYHDQSIFSVSWALLEYLQEMRKMSWDSPSNSYSTPSGDFSFMDVIRYLKNRDEHALLFKVNDDCKTYGFNTKVEVTAIENTLYS